MARKRQDVFTRPRVCAGGSRVRLGERRRTARARLIGVLGILAVFFVTLAIIGLWQSTVRVSRVNITTHDTSLVPVVEKALTGTYFWSVPHDSIFFLAKERIRRALSSARPDIAAVSISRTGFNSIAVTPALRTPLARWCGTATTTPADTLLGDVLPSANGSCYFFDGTGFLYAQAALPSANVTTTLANTVAPLVPYLVYGPLMNTSSPALLGTVAHINTLPSLFDFAREVGGFGSPVTAVVLRGDEVDLFLADKTRVTYVLGDEQNAFALLVATKDSISLSDGSLLYVDLRFPDKVYFKKRNSL